MKNKLVAYHGGGYDGCIWEWNFALYDKDGVYHSLYHSGVLGCPGEDKFTRNNIAKNKNSFVYDLSSHKKFAKFADNHAIPHVVGITKILNDKYDYNFEVRCSDCGRLVNPDEVFLEDWHGCGGIMSTADLILCEDCFFAKSCSNCGYVGDAERYFNDEHNLDGCEYCLSDEDISLCKA